MWRNTQWFIRGCAGRATGHVSPPDGGELCSEPLATRSETLPYPGLRGAKKREPTGWGFFADLRRRVNSGRDSSVTPADLFSHRLNLCLRFRAFPGKIFPGTHPTCTIIVRVLTHADTDATRTLVETQNVPVLPQSACVSSQKILQPRRQPIF